MNREEVYEDELIDAFDVDSAAPVAPSAARATPPVHAPAAPRANRAPVVLGAPASPGIRPEKHHIASNDQRHLASHGALYPSFGDEPEAANAAFVPVKPAVVHAVPYVPTKQRALAEQQDLRHHVGHIPTRQEANRMSPQLEASEPLLPSDELQRRQGQIEREMRGYQERLDHVAQALAGETPHQLEERKKRNLERLQREEKRRVAVETRVEQQIERQHEREARRIKHRTSRSASLCSDEKEYVSIDLDTAVGTYVDAGGHGTEKATDCGLERGGRTP